MRIQNLGTFLEGNTVNLCLQRIWLRLPLLITFRLSSENENLGKLLSAADNLPNLPILKAISDETGGNINKCDFLRLKKTFNVWKRCYYSVNQCLPNDWYRRLENHAWLRHPVQVSVQSTESSTTGLQILYCQQPISTYHLSVLIWYQIKAPNHLRKQSQYSSLLHKGWIFFI